MSFKHTRAFEKKYRVCWWKKRVLVECKLLPWKSRRKKKNIWCFPGWGTHATFSPSTSIIRNAKWQNTYQNMRYATNKGKKAEEENKVITIIIICYISYAAKFRSWKANPWWREWKKINNIRFEEKNPCAVDAREKKDESVCLFNVNFCLL